MWAEVVDGREFAPFIENGDHAAVDREGLALAIGDVAQFGDGNEISHISVRFVAVGSE